MSKNYSKLHTFLKSHTKKVSDDIVTHTRIKSPEHNVNGGSYHINNDEEERFFATYIEHVFKNNESEYLTEQQIKDNDEIQQGGPILIDLDFHYNGSVKERIHNKNHIETIIDIYLNKLQEDIFCFNVGDEFPVVVFEKPNINTKYKEGISKDGIHILIGIDCKKTIQEELRNLVLEDIDSELADLPIINKNGWDDVVDKAVSKRSSGWMLFGSKKPGNEAYDITGYYNCYINNDYEISKHEGNLEKEKRKIKSNVEDFKKISARYTENLKPDLKQKMKDLLNKNNKKNSNNNLIQNSNITNIRLRSHEEVYNPANINSLEELEKINNKLLDNLDVNIQSDRILKDTYEYLMIINDPKYYDNYDDWIQIGMALKNTDDRLFLSWMLFSAKSDSFDFYDILNNYSRWNGFKKGDSYLTYRSIITWCKNCYDGKSGNDNKYLKIKENNLHNLINEAVSGGGLDMDMAKIIHCIYKDDYLLADHKSDIWYKYENSKFREVAGQLEILKLISFTIYDILQRKMIENINILHFHPASESYNNKLKAVGGNVKKLYDLTNEEKKYKEVEDSISILCKICGYCKDESKKSGMYKSCRQLFHDENFLKKSDEKTHLLCFDNGVYDFNQKKFRPGLPDDYITISTNYDYIPIDVVKEKYQKEENEIRTFFNQIYPIKEMNDFIWELLASLLIGGNINTKFYMFIGNGSNGKSIVLQKLLKKVMGDYQGTLPSAYLIGKKAPVGATSSEIAKLKGVRVAIVDEPNEDETLNDGKVKSITGGDMIEARKLHQNSINFIPQFKPIVATNIEYNIKDTTEGMWRRIEKINHISYFSDVDKLDPNNPYHFEVDKTIEEKFDKWKQVLMSMLVEIARETQGKIKTPKIISDETLRYRNKQDVISDFITNRIVEQEGSKITRKKELATEFKDYVINVHGKKPPTAQKLYEAMDSRFGKFTKSWDNVKLIYEEHLYQDDDN